MPVYTRQHLRRVLDEFRRRDAFIQSLEPVEASYGDSWYHEADIRSLYPRSAMLEFENRRPCEGAVLYDLRILVGGVVVATHRAKVLTCSLGRSYAVAIAEPQYEACDELAVVAPEPSPELAAALEAAGL
jgi:hypothetical protein